MDRGDRNIDLCVVREGLGAYGQNGGNTESVVSTSELSANDLLYERDRLVNLYKPKSHDAKWGDKFFVNNQEVLG